MKEFLKWEYHIFEFEHQAYPSPADLNKLGSEGWDLVLGLPHWGERLPFLVFKRPVKESDGTVEIEVDDR